MQNGEACLGLSAWLDEIIGSRGALDHPDMVGVEPAVYREKVSADRLVK